MPLSRTFPFAILIAAVILMAAEIRDVYNAASDVPNSDTASLRWHGGGPANNPDRQLATFPARDKVAPALFLPVQFRNPDELGVGKLLVASRGIGDPSFAGTVILLIRYEANGVLGLVLNRRTDVPISGVLDLKSAKDRSDRVYSGGPVEPAEVFALLKSSAKAQKGENIFGRVYFISGKTLFDQTLSAHPDPGVFHVYLGYTGWTQAQLRHEVQLGSWFILPADDDAVFTSDPKALWLQMIQKTKVQLASTEPFAQITQPIALFR